jgi:DNA (cytosine-5)-methyltransferase 1
MSSPSSSTFKCVSLFSGAGGLDIGFERSGFHTVAMNEIEPKFAATLRANAGSRKADGRTYFSTASVINADIRELSGRDLARGERIDCVIGGPPCQAFSSAGKQLSMLDARGQLVHEYCRIIQELSPRAFLFENVRGIVTARDATGTPGGVIEGVYAELQSLGYSCSAQLLNSADFGSYQRRVRCFIVGVRHGCAPSFPQPTHSEGAGDLLALPHRSLGEFLAEHSDPDESAFVFPTERLREALERLPDGCGIKSAGVSEPTRPGGHWGYRQGTFLADKTKPARTVTGSASQDWVRWDGRLRRLTFLEVKRLQGFPDDWVFHGSAAHRFKQVGNAVPTIFGERLGAMIAAYLDDEPKGPPVKKELPSAFRKHIDYTIRDHARNASARKVHRAFATDDGEPGGR